MTAPKLGTDVQRAIKAAMAVAKDLAEGRLTPAEVDAAAVAECQALVGRVVGPDEPLWALQCDVARQVLALDGIPVDELSEWLAVARVRAGEDVVPAAASWIEQALAAMADDADDEASQN